LSPDPRLLSNQFRLGAGLWALIGAAAVFAIGQAAIAHLALGPRSAHMAAHILTMNVAAPALAVVVVAHARQSIRAFVSGKVLVIAAVLQVALLWMWHAPRIVVVGFEQPRLHAFMLGLRPN
jgi:cytochrome c oxidase assembly factor CtaG